MFTFTSEPAADSEAKGPKWKYLPVKICKNTVFRAMFRGIRDSLTEIFCKIYSKIRHVSKKQRYLI